MTRIADWDDCAVCEMGPGPCREDATCRWAREFTPDVIAACGRALVTEAVVQERPGERPDHEKRTAGGTRNEEDPTGLDRQDCA